MLLYGRMHKTARGPILNLFVIQFSGTLNLDGCHAQMAISITDF